MNLTELKGLVERATPLMTGNRANHPVIGETGKRIVGFKLDAAVAGLSDGLFMLEALQDIHRALPALISALEAAEARAGRAEREWSEAKRPRLVDQDGKDVGWERRENAGVEEVWRDENDTIWQRPTAWAYYAACRARDSWQAKAERYRAALEPFAAFGERETDEEGWSAPPMRERIVDWFGPSEFRRARLALQDGEGGAL